MIVMVRIDDRLIHGQVVEGWVNFLKATSILVADDAVASNVLQRSIMEMAVPQGLKVFIGRVDDICNRVRASPGNDERSILLFSRPSDVVRALRSGLECAALNIGGLHFTPGKQKYLDVLALDEGDLQALAEIVAKGVEVQVQAVPTQRAIPLEKALHSGVGSGKRTA